MATKSTKQIIVRVRPSVHRKLKSSAELAGRTIGKEVERMIENVLFGEAMTVKGR